MAAQALVLENDYYEYEIRRAIRSLNWKKIGEKLRDLLPQFYRRNKIRLKIFISMKKQLNKLLRNSI